MINQEGINSLNTGAEAITYQGTEGPKSPEQDQAIALGIPEGLTLDEAIRTFDLAVPEKANLKGMEKLQEVIEFFRTRTLSGGQPLPQDPTKPINPFGPKPTGPVLPREMAAFGGIMGLDNRKQYGIGSKFKRAFNKVTKPFVKVSQKLMPKELAGISQMAAPFLGPVYGPLLMAAGQAKQKGRISPTALAMSMLPYAKFKGGEGIRQFTPTGYGSMGSGQSLRNLFLSGETRPDDMGFFTEDQANQVGGKYKVGDAYSLGSDGSFDKGTLLPGDPSLYRGQEPIFGKYGKAADKFLFGSAATEGGNQPLDPEAQVLNLPGAEQVYVPGNKATSGIIGSAGKVGNLFSGEGLEALKASKLAGAALGKDGQLIASGGKGGLSLLKLGSWGVSIVSGIQAGKYANEMEAANAAEQALIDSDNEATQAEVDAARAWAIETFGSMSVYADGGRINKNMGGEMDMGGISSLQTQASDVTPPGMELDLRGGGFIPIGTAEKADDVPARVSKNEFVFTADAVKAAGGGSVNEGAKKMYDTMKRLESQVG